MGARLSRPATPGTAHMQPTYHVARGSSSATSSPRVIGPQAVRTGHLPISSIVASGAHTVSYQVSHQVAPAALPASLVVPVTSVGAGPPVLPRAAPAAPSPAGGPSKMAAKAAKLSTVTMTPAGVGVRGGGPARLTLGPHRECGPDRVTTGAAGESGRLGDAPPPAHHPHHGREAAARAGRRRVPSAAPGRAAHLLHIAIRPWSAAGDARRDPPAHIGASAAWRLHRQYRCGRRPRRAAAADGQGRALVRGRRHQGRARRPSDHDAGAVDRVGSAGSEGNNITAIPVAKLPLAPSALRTTPAYGVPAGVVYEHTGYGAVRPPVPAPFSSCP
ncbi:translation initiation factor IF-2-like [Pollicipes pollicipes]|uniref:translation initiation factor IF-2-like n=1 Tax=Pollicipes pollicipes TaxID=41117 RepID=UPI0018858097|nr:translation initiation factor IF-2-like [Pollicipes pollicipes]